MKWQNVFITSFLWLNHAVSRGPKQGIKHYLNMLFIFLNSLRLKNKFKIIVRYAHLKGRLATQARKKDQGQDQALFSRKKSVQVACSQLVVLNRQLSATRELATGSLSLVQGKPYIP